MRRQRVLSARYGADMRKRRGRVERTSRTVRDPRSERNARTATVAGTGRPRDRSGANAGCRGAVEQRAADVDTLVEQTERPYQVRTVRQFTAGMADFLNRQPWLERIGIKGEISGLRVFGDGHLGFSLKEERALVECIAWADWRRGLPEVKDGDVVIAVGRVRIHPERGAYKLYADELELAGLGELFLQYERLRK